MTGFVFNIQRHSIHDGPGIRTILFFKGCTMSCKWCSNPESLLFTKELSFNPTNCIECRACQGLCPSGAIRMTAGGLFINRSICTVCEACIEVCYAEALNIEGWEITVEEAVNEVLKDEVFYRSSKGGLTLGGGEPLAQPEFAAAVLESVHSRGVSTAVETAGHVPWENFLLVYPHTDCFLFDIKHTDPEKHKQFTGVDTSLIQENLKRLLDVHSHVIARVPVIPCFNFSEEELLAISDSAAKAGLREINFLPYHGYGSGKYDLLGKEYLMKNLRPLPGTAEITELLLKLKPAIEALGLRVQIGG